MKWNRRETGGYHGRRPRGGVSASQVVVVALVTMLAILAMTIRASCQITGNAPAEEIYIALFVAKDWE